MGEVIQKYGNNYSIVDRGREAPEFWIVYEDTTCPYDFRLENSQINYSSKDDESIINSKIDYVSCVKRGTVIFDNIAIGDSIEDLERKLGIPVIEIITVENLGVLPFFPFDCNDTYSGMLMFDTSSGDVSKLTILSAAVTTNH